MFRISSAFQFARRSAACKAADSKMAKVQMVPLAFTHPLLVAGWMGAASGKFESPETIPPTSVRLGWWRCGSCSEQFRRRVVDHVVCGGLCPHCSHKPTRIDVALSVPKAEIAARPIQTSATTMSAHNPSTVKKHITDIPYFSEGAMRKVLQPMLAKAFEDCGHKIKFEKEAVYVSPKIDGIRCLIARDPTTKVIYYFSRQGLLMESCDHLTHFLESVFTLDPTAVLDGELYNKSLTFEELMSTVSTTKSKRTPLVEAAQRTVQYHAFDLLTASKIEALGFTERMARLSAIMANAASASNGLLQIVPNVPITSIADAFNARDEYIAQGFEGAMLRRGSSPYAHGKRSPYLLKMKCVQDAEFKIVGAIEGQGKMANALGAFVCQTARGETFTVAPSVDEAKRKDLWAHAKSMIGAALTVQFQELSSQGIPRFPVGKAIRGGSMEVASWL